MKLHHKFTTVAGQGLGISYGSLNQVGKILPSDNGYGHANINSYVNVATGNLILQDHVVSIANRVPIEFSYIYNSHAANSGSGWRLAHKQFKQLPVLPIHLPGQTAVLIEADGHETIYTSTDNRTWVAPKLGDGTPYLKCDETNRQWIWFHPKTQTTEYYDLNGYLLKRENATGQTITFEYDQSQNPWQLKAVMSNIAERYELRRSPFANGVYTIAIYLKKDQSEELLQSHVFDNLNRLTQTIIPIKSSANYQIQYSYENSSNERLLSRVVQADKTTLFFDYELPSSRGAIQRLIRFSANEPAKGNLFHTDFVYPNTKQAYVTLLDGDIENRIYLDPQERPTRLDSQLGHPGRQQEPTVFDTTLFHYAAAGQIQEIDYPGGGVEVFKYDEDYGNTTAYGLLRAHTKTNKGIINYVYHPQHPGLVVCEIRSLSNGKYATTRYVYDDNYGIGNKPDKKLFLRFKISPEGRVTEYRPTLEGDIASERTYLDARYELKLLNSNDTAPPLRDMLAWVQQQKADRVNLKKYVYSPLNGQLGYIYSYGKINAQGEGDNHDPLTGVTSTFYDIYGNLTLHQTIQNRGSKTLSIAQQSFDNLQRLVESETPLHEVTKYEYDDANSQVTITHPNGRKEIQHWDTKGFVTGESQHVVNNGKEEIRATTYDSRTGECLVWLTTHPDQQKTFEFYNRQRQLNYTVSRTGLVTQYEHNQQKRYKATTRYSIAIAQKELMPAQIMPPVGHLMNIMQKYGLPADPLARTSYEFFDEAGRLRYQVDAENYVTEFRYDTFDHPIAKIAYAEKLTDAQLNQLKDAQGIQLPFNKNKDRCARTFYDADGFIIGEQDARGYVTEYVRNGAGWVTKKTLYATPQNINLQIKDFIRPQPNADKDASTYYFYNNRGLCEIEVDAEGYITEKNYLTGGLVDKTIRHQTNVKDIDPNWLTQRDRLPILPATTAEDLVTQHQYDRMDREASALDANDNVQTNTAYDNMGHVIASNHQDINDRKVINGDTFRGTQTQYDPWEQITREANPFVAEKLKHVDCDPNLSQVQKDAEKKAIWDKFSKRHFYDATGLKVKTAACITDVNQNKDNVDDQITFYYYDLERRPIILITVLDNNQVMIQEDSYNSFGEVESTRRYSQKKSVLAPEIIAKLSGGFVTDELRKALDGIKDDNFDVINKTPRNKRGLIEQKTDPENCATTYQYNAFKECESEVLPIKDSQQTLTIKHQFDAGGHEVKTIKEAADSQTIEIERKFENPYGKQTKLVDEVGCQHNVEYDRLGRSIKQSTTVDGKEIVDQTLQLDGFGRAVTETDALNQTTYSTYNRNKRSCVVRKSPNINFVFATVQNNIFNQTVKHTNGLDCTEQFQHAPDGKLVQHIDELGYTTTDRYNLLGWRVERETANKTKTKFNHNRAGLLIEKVMDDNGFSYSTKLTRDSLGNVKTVTDPRDIKTNNEFDRRGKLTKKTNTSTNSQTINQYNDQGSLISQTKGDLQNPDQYLQTHQRDGFNRTVGDTVDPITETRKDALNIETQQKLNNAGKVVVAIDANGNKTFNYYDQRGNQCFQILPDGGVTEWSYNAMDKVVMQRKYEMAIASEDFTKLNEQTSLVTLKAMMLPMTSQQDTVTRYFYDVNNRECFSVKLLFDFSKQKFKGMVKEKRYDATWQIFEEVEYAKYLEVTDFALLTTDQLVTLMTQLSDPKQDSHTFYLRDAKSQAAFIIDAENYITQQVFSPTGKIISKVRYADPVPNPRELVATPVNYVLQTLKQRALLSSDDRYEYFVFDTLDRPLYSVNGEGSVIRFTHDGNDNVTEEYHFAEKVKVPQDYKQYDQLVNQLNTLKQNPELDRVTKKEYDADNNLIKVTDACSNSDHYKHDALGNVIEHTDRNGAVWKTAFDRASRAQKEVASTVDITTVTVNGQEATAQTVAAAVEKHQQHDKLGHLTQQGLAANTTEKRVINSRYDACNRLIETQLENIDVEGVGKVNLTQQIRYNAQGLKIAEKDFNDVWTFYIYDNQGREIYRLTPYKKVENKTYQYTVIKTERINAAGYGANGSVTHEIRYATPIELDTYSKQLDFQQGAAKVSDRSVQLVHEDCELSGNTAENSSAKSKPDYQETGIPRTLLDEFTDKANVKSNSDNRHLYKQYNRRGELIKLEQNELFYYLPTTESGDATMGYAVPTTVQQWNAFGECCYQTKTIGEKLLAEATTWFDHAGRETVVIDPILRTKHYARNSFGEESARTEYANRFTQALSPSLTLAGVMSQLSTLRSEGDHRYLTEYNRLGKVSKKITCDVVTQKGNTIKEGTNKGLPCLEDEPAQDLVTEAYTYTPTGKIATITDANGGTQYIYYNAWDVECARTEVARVQVDGTTEKTLIPLTHIGINAHGQAASVKRFASGAKHSTIESGLHLQNKTKAVGWVEQRETQQQTLLRPEPVAENPATDPEELTRYDTRGLANYKRDPKKNGKQFGYTATGKIAKEEWKITNFETKAPFNQKVSTDQRCYSYTLTDKPELEVLIRDNDIKQITQSFYNNFSEYVGEGPGDGTMPLRHDRDPVGNIWRSNKIHGDGKTYSSSTITVRDLLGQESMQLESDSLDLSTVTYDGLKDFLSKKENQNPSLLERTETTRDLVGRMTAKTSPANYRLENNQLKILARRRYGHDNWDNVVWEENNLGYRTEFVFNRCNKLLQTVQPEIEVMDDAGKLVKLRPTTRNGYNKNQQLIGTTNARGYTELHGLDAAGHEIKQILGDGLESRVQVWNALNQIISHSDASGIISKKKWQHIYDLNNNLIEMISPMGLSTKYGRNELNFCASETDPAGNITRYNQSVTGAIEARIEPMGEVWIYTKEYRSKLVIETEKGPDGKTLIWQRTYFDVLITHTDLSGAIYTYKYDGKLQLVDQQSSGGNHGIYFNLINNGGMYLPVRTATPGQYMRYVWSQGLLRKIIDVAHNRQTDYDDYDFEGRRMKVKSFSKGTLIRETTCKRNAVGWDIEAADQGMKLQTIPDANGNQRLQKFNSPFTTQTYERENRFDSADRVVFDAGLTIGYANGLRSQETRNGNTILLTYDDDGLFVGTKSTAGAVLTRREYDPTGYTKLYEDKTIQFKHQISCNANGLQVGDTQTSGVNPLSNTNTVFAYTQRGALNYQNVDRPNDIHPTKGPRASWDTFASSASREAILRGEKMPLIEFDEEKISGIGALRKWSGIPDYVFRRSLLGHDANGMLVSIINGGFVPPLAKYANDGEWWGDNAPCVLFEAGADGVVSIKYNLICHLDDRGPGAEPRQPTDWVGWERYLIDVDNNVKVGYTNWGTLERKYGFNSPSVNLSYQGQGVAGGRGFSWRADTGNSVLGAIPQPSLGSMLNVNVHSAIQEVSETYPPPIPKKVIAKKNQTYGEIAQTWLGNSEYGSLLEQVNRGTEVVGQYGMDSGREVKLPQLIAYKNNMNTHESYEKFMSTMVSNIYPHLALAPEKPKQGGILEIIVGVVATVAAFCVAGPLGGGAAAASLLGVESVVGGVAVMTGVVAGLTQAALQGVAKGVGLIKEVSWQQAVGAGIGAGILASPLGTELSATLKSLLDAGAIDPKVLGNAILQSGKIAVATELLSMAAGTKKAFDFENVLVTMGSTLSNIGIAKATSSEVTRATLNSLSNTALDSVAHNNYQLESMAANLLGSAVQYGAQKGMEAFSSSHYEAAQRGETVKPNNASRLNGTNAGNRTTNRNLPSRAAPHHAATYFDDPLLHEDFAQTLNPRIGVNSSNNAFALGDGVAEINRRTYLQSQGHAAQQTQQRVSTTSQVLNALNAAGNSQFIAGFNQTVETLRDAPGNELLSVYRGLRYGNSSTRMDTLARGAVDVLSLLPSTRIAHTMISAETFVIDRQLLGKSLYALEQLGSSKLNDMRYVGLNAVGRLGNKFGLAVDTPYGYAFQSFSSEALAARRLVKEETLLYRAGTTRLNETRSAQFWSLENPLTTKNYAQKYGIPYQNSNFNFVEAGNLAASKNFITRPAPGVGVNAGGGIETVTEINGVNLRYWFMP